jgi:hypothetical protein
MHGNARIKCKRDKNLTRITQRKYVLRGSRTSIEAEYCYVLLEALTHSLDLTHANNSIQFFIINVPSQQQNANYRNSTV